MGKEYRIIQPSRHEGKISRKDALLVFRGISEGKIAVREKDSGADKPLTRVVQGSHAGKR